MTVGVSICCKDGIVLACDSLATFGRGVPVQRSTNKIHILTHDALRNDIAIIPAGALAYFDKFKDRAMRDGLARAATSRKRDLDVVDFCEAVCEPIVAGLMKQYQIDRYKLLGVPSSSYSLAMIVAGCTIDGELRTYNVWDDGITESQEGYGTVGSGAAYAELFLRFLLKENYHKDASISDISRIALYVVEGVGMMDPYVGGETHVYTMTMKDNKLRITPMAKKDRPSVPRKKMEEALRGLGGTLEKLVKGSKNVKKSKKQ